MVLVDPMEHRVISVEEMVDQQCMFSPLVPKLPLPSMVVPISMVEVAEEKRVRLEILDPLVHVQPAVFIPLVVNVVDALDVVLDMPLVIMRLVEIIVTVVREDVDPRLVPLIVGWTPTSVYQEPQAERVVMVDLGKDTISPEPMDHREQRELLVDVILMVDLDRLERLVVMEETGEHQEEIHQTQEREDHLEEQSQDRTIA